MGAARSATGPIRLARSRRGRLVLVLGVPAAILLLFWNFQGLVATMTALPRAGSIGDWFYWGWVDPSDPYSWDWVRWSPPAVWLWLSFVYPLGIGVVIAAHFVALLFLRDWRIILAILLVWPFWEDVLNGGTITFAFVAGWLALNGSRAGTALFFLQAALIPRPLMLPITAWLLWKRSSSRWLFLIVVAAVGLATLASGDLLAWVQRLVSSGGEIRNPFNIAPSAWFGFPAAAIGAILAAIFTWRGRLGLASLAASPYLFVYYLLFGLFELWPWLGRRRVAPDTSTGPFELSERTLG